jgi:hypothetical protein
VALKTGTQIPLGKQWSDTRLMAWLCSIYGVGFMDWIGEKGVAYGPDYMEVFTGKDGWKKIDDVWVSNEYFHTRKKVEEKPKSEPKRDGVIISRNILCRAPKCTRMDIDDTGFCFECREKRRKDAFATANATNGNVKEEAKSKDPLVWPTVELAELMFKEKNCSKQYLKKVRKYWQTEHYRVAKENAKKAVALQSAKNIGPVLPPD